MRFEPAALLVLLAAVSTAGYFIVSKHVLRRYSPLESTAYAIWAGTVPMLVFAPGLVRQMPHAAPSATLAVVYLGVFPAAIAYVLWNYALARMPASLLSTFLYLSPVLQAAKRGDATALRPVLAMLIAWVWIGEVPAVLTIVGGLVAIGGVIIVQTMGQTPARAAELAADPIEASVG